VERVGMIPPERSGKYRYVVSHVQPPGVEPAPGVREETSHA